MYKNILVGVDGSEHSLKAMQEAMKIASLSDKCVVEVITIIDFSKSKDEILHAQGKEDLELQRRKKLMPVEEMLKENNLMYQINVLHGDPGPAIVEYANKGEFDMVVIGSSGRGILHEMVLGSVSHKIAKRVKCPVLIVK